MLATQLYRHHYCQVMAIQVTTKSTDDENIALSTGTSSSTSASLSTDASFKAPTFHSAPMLHPTPTICRALTHHQTPTLSPDTNTSPNIDASLMHASKGILNLPTSILHLCSPFQQNRWVKIHHQFISFQKQLGQDSPPRK